MSEGYAWVNVDKKEYLEPTDFDYGSRRLNSITRGNSFLCALYDLLSNEWANDHILWMGEELIPKTFHNDTLKILYEDSVKLGYPGDSFDTVYDSYKNISSLFKLAEPRVREEVEFYLEDCQQSVPLMNNEYGVNIEDPYKGFFLRNGKDFCYTINHTKKLYYSFKDTKILFQNHKEDVYLNPLPVLMGYGRECNPGDWLGDIIGVSNTIPAGYQLLKEIYLDW